MLKTSGSIKSKTQPDKSGVEVSGNRVGRDGSKPDRNRIDDDEVDSDEVRDDEIGTKVQKSSKNLSKFKKTVRSDFLTPGAKLAFTELRQAFFKTPIHHYFDPERHIWIQTDVSGYAIGGVLSQLTSDNSS